MKTLRIAPLAATLLLLTGCVAVPVATDSDSDSDSDAADAPGRTSSAIDADEVTSVDDSGERNTVDTD